MTKESITSDRKSLRALLTFGLIAALLALTYTAARWGLADVYAKPARRAIAQWESLKIQTPPPDEWRAALDSMRAAHALDQTNANYTEAMGRLYDLAAGNRASHPATNAFRRQALVYFADAARYRITSPYTWSNIALIKLGLGEIDGIFLNALKNAASLGPWEPEVQFAVADAGLATWQRLPDDIREVVKDSVARGKTQYAKEVQQIIESHRRPK